MKQALALAIVLIAVISTSAEEARFDNYRYYSIAIENDLQLRALKELSEVSDSVGFNNVQLKVVIDLNN